MANLIRLTLFSLLLPCVVFARVDSFKVSLPPSWKDLSDEPQYSVFENQKSPERLETVVIQKFGRFAKDDTVQSTLETHSKDLTKIRGHLFRRLGLGNYTVLEIKKHATPKSDFGYYQEIHSRYLAFDGRETQMLERQYATRESLYVVTYVVRDSALNNRAHVARLLDLVRPVASKRLPASEIVKGGEAAPAVSGEVSDVPPVKEPRALDMNSAEAKKFCANVQDESVRRKPGEGAGFDSLSEQFYKLKGCATGVVQSLWGMVTGAISALGWIDQVTSMGESSSRDQLYSAVGVIAKEIKQDGIKSFAWKVGTGLYEAVSKEVSDFPCYSNEEQMRKVCAILGNAIPPGILIKLATRVTLTAKEAAELAAAIRKGNVTPAAKTAVAEAAPVPAPAPASSQMGRFADGSQTLDQARKEAVSAAAPAERAQAAQAVTDAYGKYQKIKGRYGDLLPPNKAEHAKIFELIEKAEARGVGKNKIRDTLRIEGARCTR
jgi:hypothetical protein